MAEYKYYIKKEGSSAVQVFPTNADNLIYKYDRRGEAGIVFERLLETSLKFNYESGNFNFRTQELTDKCEEIDIIVQKICDGEKEIFYHGVFAIMEGKFDPENCVYEIKPRVKRDLIDDIQVNILDVPNPVVEGGVTGVRAYNTNANPTQRTYQQCRYFDEVILFVAQKSNPNIQGIISNFFQINPDGVFYIPGITNYWENMAFGSLSDIQEPIPSNLSTLAQATFREIMDDLNVLFDVFYFIDDNFNLRIEHRIYFQGSQGLVLTGSQYKKYIKKKYEYVIDDLPKEETWKIQGSRESATLIYSGISRTKKQENSKVYQTKVINTDYQERMLNGGSEEGLFLFATNGGVGTGGVWTMYQGGLTNLKLTAPYLVKNLHTYDRPSLYAIFRQKTQYFWTNSAGGMVLNSTKPNKIGEEFSIPLCCGDEFDTKDHILTPLGKGFLDKASFSTKDSMLKLSLRYKTDECEGIEPDDLSGLALWLKQGDVQTTGAYVNQWNDSSGNARHAVGVGATRPTYFGIENPSSVNFIQDPFNSDFSYLTTPAFQLCPNKRGTIFILMRTILPFAGGYGIIPILSTHSGGAGNFFDISLNENRRFVSYQYNVGLPDNLNTNNYGLYPGGLYTFTRHSDIRVKCVQNSVPCFNNPASITNDQPGSYPLIIGSNMNVPYNFPLNVGTLNLVEIIIYDRELTDFEREKIEFYLVKKGIYTTYPAI